ncbi:NAD(P)-dependent oxidoreductase [Hymenobacter elongatus]|uniref:SDR family oxidoreductase n=1 Tax=Hymenobacter elongatus TaxID=877208 RepID=A0A4Z0PIH5_9BACT|nr:SDR family oxidoreductase [Hymenobacter elongatus]TGE14107.1 SDR family oxidoreductase [Hymenobacter elongatus]
MKRIALFGGSGLTGQEFLKLALQHGYPVSALARTPAKIPQTSPNLQVVPGDVLNAEDVSSIVRGADIVVSLFGQVKNSPKDVQTRGTAHIVAAMQQHGVRRIISLSGGGLPYAEDQPQLADRLIRGIMRLAVPHVLTDAQSHADVLRASGLDWEIVRGPRLTTEVARKQYRVGWVGVNASTSIGRADLADFILKQVESDEFVGKMPFVSR